MVARPPPSRRTLGGVLRGAAQKQAQASPDPLAQRWAGVWHTLVDPPGAGAAKPSEPRLVKLGPDPAGAGRMAGSHERGVLFGLLSETGLAGRWRDEDGRQGDFSFRLTTPDSFSGLWRADGAEVTAAWHGVRRR